MERRDRAVDFYCEHFTEDAPQSKDVNRSSVPTNLRQICFWCCIHRRRLRWIGCGGGMTDLEPGARTEVCEEHLIALVYDVRRFDILMTNTFAVHVCQSGCQISVPRLDPSLVLILGNRV